MPKGVSDQNQANFETDPKAADEAQLKIRRIGNSLGVILPKDLLAHLAASEGETIEWRSLGNGRIEIASVENEADQLMELAEQIMEENRGVLRALAK